MKILLKNTTNEVLNISDIGISVLPLSELSIDTNIKSVELSNTLINLVISGKIIINNYQRDLLPIEGVKFITTNNLYPLDSEGKLYVHQTSKTLGTTTYWTGQGDDPNDITNVGDGEKFIISNYPDDPFKESIYLDFNTINNNTSLHEGYFIWKNAQIGDFLTLEMVTNTVTFVPSAGTNFKLYNNFLIIPADGDGDVMVTTDITNPCISGGSLVQVYTDESGYRPNAYWDADFNVTTNRFENFRPNIYGNGEYNMFAVEIIGNRFVNHIPVVGDGFECLQSSDSTYYPHGLRVKVEIESMVDDHEWHVGGILTMHRAKTI